MAQLQVFKVGYSSIEVNDNEFEEGYYNGLIGHSDREHPVTVEAIRQIIDEAVTDTSQTADWNTGYLVGAIRGIAEGSYQSQRNPDAPYIQIGALTLHLDRWRFRDGYYNGQHDYEVNSAGRAEPCLVTARELLSYIAHRNPETNTYFFGEQELSALEDALGQLVGYVCAAFRPG